MLDAFAVVKLEILFHLRFLFAFGRFVDRKFHKAVAVAHHFAHERRIFGRNIFVVEGEDVSEPHHVLVKFHPGIHLVPTDVADAMIAIKQASLLRLERRIPLHEPGHERTGVIVALNEHVHDFAVSMDPAHHDFAVLVL